MTEEKSLPKWMLIVSGIFALMEIMVSLSLFLAPQSVVQTVDLNVKGVDYLIYMWGTRQLALGAIFAFATFKKSIPMLTLAYVFFLVMFIGDLVIGIRQKEVTMIIAAVVMCVISSLMLVVLNKKNS